MGRLGILGSGLSENVFSVCVVCDMELKNGSVKNLVPVVQFV